MSAVMPFAWAKRREAELLHENHILRSLVELMAMRIPKTHMPPAEQHLLTEILSRP